MPEIIFYAICDTNGGRERPVPLARHIYPTREAAEQARQYRGMEPEHYPVYLVRVSW